MRKPGLPVYRTLRPLVAEGTTAQSVRLRSGKVLIEVKAVAPDIFRLRSTSAGRFSERPSWAVCKTDWAPVSTRIKIRRGLATLQTSAGTLDLSLRDGGWKLTDRRRKEIFASLPKVTGFADKGCQLTLRLMEAESIFGLGETTGTFNKRGLIREFWNIDVLGHVPAIYPGLRSLYVSIPFAISLRAGRAAGFFWDNPARQTWDIGQTNLEQWKMQAAGEMDFYLFLGPRVQDVLRRYTELTGRMPLPPGWALGYHQCRYSYETAARVEEVAGNFRRRKIPCDALYLDIHHMNGYRVFTFGKAFPKPAALLARLARQGFKVVAIVDPGVKDDAKFGVLRRGLRANAFVKAPDGKKDFVGKVWPGESRFPDFLNARVRRWWGREQEALTRLGVAGFWNDMNEPANFGLPSKTLPLGCRHETDFGRVNHAEAHNVYGLLMARASREGALAQQPNRRPFVITRASYAGVQRYALVWTGDNSSVWEHLADAVQMCLNLGVSGLAFCGGDVGGFLDNTTPELLVRWTQMAAFTPFFRNHSNIQTIDQEPWAFGPEVEAICRQYIDWRYRLLPYLYVLFVEAHRTGTPIMRPLFWHYQADPVAVATGDQFLLGRDLLVAPILRQGAAARSVYLPRGVWFNFWTDERIEGGRHIVAEAPLETIPLFARAGAIIPLMRPEQYVGERAGRAAGGKSANEVIDLHIWPGAPGELNWYEDDAVSMDFTRGDYHERRIRFTPKGRGGVLQFGVVKGAYPSMVKTWRLRFGRVRRPIRAVAAASLGNEASISLR